VLENIIMSSMTDSALHSDKYHFKNLHQMSLARNAVTKQFWLACCCIAYKWELVVIVFILILFVQLCNLDINVDVCYAEMAQDPKFIIFM